MRFLIEDNRIFRYNFHNLTDLYDYLKSNPEINSCVFEKQASIKSNEEFSGEPLDVAIEYLKGGYNIDFEKFDLAIKDIRKLGYQDRESRNLERTLHGGMYLVPLVAAGAPDCMVRYIQDSEPRHITIYFQLGYPHFAKPSEINNRGIATINLIQTLEDKGYIVDLKVFEVARHGDEYIDIIVNLKNIDEVLNVSKCYFPFVAKEFLRRLLFRVFESTPVKNNWGMGYGRTISQEEIKEFYNLKPKDLVIPSPEEIGIKGNSIYEDTAVLFECLGLDREFDLSKLKEKQKVKTK